MDLSIILRLHKKRKAESEQFTLRSLFSAIFWVAT